MKISKGFYFTITAAIFWAFAIITIKFIFLLGENPLNLAFWLALLATPYWLFLFSKNYNEFKNATRKDYFILIGIGLISTIAVSIVEAFAIKNSPAINYSFLVRTVILFTIIFASIFLKEKITYKKILLTILILIGAYFLTTNGQGIILGKGDLYTLVDAALIAFGNTILGKMAVKRMSPNLSASGSFIIGLIPITLITLFNNAINWPKSFWLIILATIFYILGPMFRFRAYQHASAAYVTMIYSFTPVLVSFLAMLLLKESMSALQFLGGFLIISAGVFVEKLKI